MKTHSHNDIVISTFRNKNEPVWISDEVVDPRVLYSDTNIHSFKYLFARAIITHEIKPVGLEILF